jgi:hypothetical protein
VFPLTLPVVGVSRAQRDAMHRALRAPNLHRRKRELIAHRNGVDAYTGLAVQDDGRVNYQVDHVIEVQLVARCLLVMRVLPDDPGAARLLSVVRTALNHYDNLNVTESTINGSKGRAFYLFSNTGPYIGMPISEVVRGFKSAPYITAIKKTMVDAYERVRELLGLRVPLDPYTSSTLALLVSMLDVVMSRVHGLASGEIAPRPDDVTHAVVCDEARAQLGHPGEDDGGGAAPGTSPEAGTGPDGSAGGITRGGPSVGASDEASGSVVGARARASGGASVGARAGASGGARARASGGARARAGGRAKVGARGRAKVGARVGVNADHGDDERAVFKCEDALGPDVDELPAKRLE